MLIPSALLMVVLTITFLAYPFFKRQGASNDFTANKRAEELWLKRHNSRQSLEELEFDYSSGVVSEKDYLEMKSSFQDQADLKSATRQSKTDVNSAEDSIERQIASMRQKTGAKGQPSVVKKQAPPLEDDIERMVAERRLNRDRFCSRCGVKLSPDARFCPKCGSKAGV